MDFKELKKKLKEYDYKKLFKPRNLIIVGCVFLIGVAVLVNSLLPTAETNGTEDGKDSGKILGNPVLVDNNMSEVPANVEVDENDYFAVSTINRQRMRDEAMGVLRQIAENPDTLQTAKDKALADIADIVAEMNSEANVESLVKAKGFTNCVAVLSGDKANVIVESEGLLANEVAQILEIVYLETGIIPDNVRVIEK